MGCVILDSLSVLSFFSFFLCVGRGLCLVSGPNQPIMCLPSPLFSLLLYPDHLLFSLSLFTLYFPPLGNNVCLIHLPNSNRRSILSLFAPFLRRACHLADHVAPADTHSPSHASKQTRRSAERMDRGGENPVGRDLPWAVLPPSPRA